MQIHVGYVISKVPLSPSRTVEHKQILLIHHYGFQVRRVCPRHCVYRRTREDDVFLGEDVEGVWFKARDQDEQPPLVEDRQRTDQPSVIDAQHFRKVYL